MADEDIYDRVCFYLEKNGVEVDDSNDQLFMLYDNGDDKGVRIGKWNFPIEKPTKKELKEITKEDLRKYNSKKEKAKLKNDRLYPLIDRLCQKLGVNINELIDEL